MLLPVSSRFQAERRKNALNERPLSKRARRGDDRKWAIAERQLFETAVTVLGDEQDGLPFIVGLTKEGDGSPKHPWSKVFRKVATILVSGECVQPISVLIMPNVHASI